MSAINCTNDLSSFFLNILVQLGYKIQWYNLFGQFADVESRISYLLSFFECHMSFRVFRGQKKLILIYRHILGDGKILVHESNEHSYYTKTWKDVIYSYR